MPQALLTDGGRFAAALRSSEELERLRASFVMTFGRRCEAWSWSLRKNTILGLHVTAHVAGKDNGADLVMWAKAEANADLVKLTVSTGEHWNGTEIALVPV